MIALSGCQEPGTRQKAVDAGIDLFLVKPVPLGVLTDVLEKFWRVIGPAAIG